MAELGRRLKVVDRERVDVEAFEVRDPGPGQVLVRVSRTQVSAGTEKSHLLPLPPDHPSVGLERSTDTDADATSDDTPPLQPTRPRDTPGYTAVGRVRAVGRHSSHLVVNP